MTPFGIRKKLKGLLNQSDGPSYSTYSLTFVLPDGTKKTIETEERYSLLMAADAKGITISTGRRAGGTCPDGLCALCRVEIEDATGLSPMNEFELQALDNAIAGTAHEGRPRKPAPPKTPNTRLGCHTKVVGDGAVVRIPALFDPDSIRGE